MNRLISLIALALLAPACDDGTTGIALDFEPATEGAALTLATDFEVNRLEALVSELKMLPDKDPAKEAENTKFKAKGSFFVNALDPDDSTIPPVPLPAGSQLQALRGGAGSGAPPSGAGRLSSRRGWVARARAWLEAPSLSKRANWQSGSTPNQCSPPSRCQRLKAPSGALPMQPAPRPPRGMPWFGPSSRLLAYRTV